MVTSLKAVPYGQLHAERRRPPPRRPPAPSRRHPMAHPGAPEHQAGGRGQRDEHRPAAEQPDVERHDQQRRDHHVELVGGEAGVPVGRPAGDAPLGQQVVAEVGRAPHVGAHVATGRAPRSTGARPGAGWRTRTRRTPSRRPSRRSRRTKRPAALGRRDPRRAARRRRRARGRRSTSIPVVVGPGDRVRFDEHVAVRRSVRRPCRPSSSHPEPRSAPSRGQQGDDRHHVEGHVGGDGRPEPTRLGGRARRTPRRPARGRAAAGAGSG